MIYTFLTLFLFILSYSLLYKHKSINILLYYFVLTVLFFFSAFRYKVGCDWAGYYHNFINSDHLEWRTIALQREFLYWIVVKLLNDMNLSYPIINVVSSFIFFIGVHVLARRQPNPLSFLVLLFPILIINMPMSALRQGAAIGIICIAFTALIDRRPILYIFWVSLATGIHSSAIVFLLLIPFTTGRYNNNRLLASVFIAIPALFLFTFLESAQTAKSIYVGTDREAYGAIFRLSILALSGFYFILFVKKKWFQRFRSDYSIVSIGSISMILLPFLMVISTIIGDRYGYYLIPIQAMIFSRLPYLPFKMNHNIHIIFPYLILFLVFVTWTQTSWHFQKCYIPYDNWIL